MATLPCRALLQERTIEIRLYIRFLRKILDNNAELYFPSTTTSHAIEKELTHTLKANGYLLLYNAIEAICAAAIEDIHNAVEAELKSGGASFSVENLNTQLIQQVLRRFKASVKLEYKEIKSGPSRWLVEHWLKDHKQQVANNHNPLMSGNLDGRAMRIIAETYGFDSYGSIHMPKNRSPQVTKQKRNDLAHGHESFTQCGRNLSLQDLVRDAVGVVIYLRRYVGAVEEFINKRGFVAPALIKPASSCRPTASASLGGTALPINRATVLVETSTPGSVKL